MSLHSYIGLVGGICSLAAYVPFAISVVRGKIQLERASWLVWTLSSVLILFSSWEIGIRATIWVPLAYVIGSGAMTVLALMYGKEGWNRFEKLALVVAIISSIRWVYFDQPLFALVVTLVIGLMGYIPRIADLIKRPHAPAKPELEVWTLLFIGSIFNLIAVDQWTPVLAAVPVALFILNAVLLGLTFRNSLQTKAHLLY